MRKFIFGTILVILGGVLVFVFAAFGIPRNIGIICGITISVVGYIIQMSAIFRAKREMESETERFTEISAQMRPISNMSPEQAIEMLRKSVQPGAKRP